MESIELYLLKLFLNPEFYAKFSPCLRRDFVRDNNKLLGSIFDSVGQFHSDHPDKTLSPTDLQVWYLSLYPALPKAEKELLGKLCQNLEKVDANPDVAEKYARSHQEQAKATEIAKAALDVSQGRGSYENLLSLLSGIDKEEKDEQKEEFVSDDLGYLLDQTFRTPGLRWRLKTLNQMLGSLRRGDFGFIFKRPETGGTTLLASEVTFMATQSERPVLWVNNEEQGSKVKLRCYEAYFGQPLKALVKDWAFYQKEYLSKMGGRIKLYDKAFVTASEVERVCKKENPCLIIFDQIDKIKGFDADRYDLEMKATYQWSRELAKEYGPVIGICQASASAENKQWLSMDDVDSSKTAKQGEADWMLGIGKQYKEGMENVRYFSAVKNKLVGDEDTLEEMRHGKAPVIIIPQIARFADYSGS
jgi:replicative DNA helicase